MLTVDFDPRQNICRQQVRNLTVLISNDRRIGNSSFNQICTLCWSMGTYTERNPSSAPQNLTNHPAMRLAGFLADGFQVQYISQALYNGGLPGSSPPYQDVQILIEVYDGTVKEPSLPRHAEEFRMLFRLGVTIQPYPRVRIEERLTQPLDGNL